MIASAPERTRCGNDSVTEMSDAEADSVEAQAKIPQAAYSANALRSRSSIMKQGNTARARHSHGTTMTGLRPNLSESQPPSGSQITPPRPTMAVAPKAIFGDIPNVELA